MTDELSARIREILGPGLGSERGAVEGVFGDLQAAVLGPKGRPADVTDYAKLFRAIPRPAISMTWQHDDTFAWLRVAGPNPALIRRVTEVEKRLKLTDERFSSVMGDPQDSVERALDDHRLFACDYEVVGRVLSPGKYRGIPKFVSAPLALFAVPRTGAGRLRPVAIHCEGVTTRAAAFFPSDGQAWKLARQVVQIADANHHELVTHLARTHLYIEVILLATRRNLAPNHPVNRLLVPHFEGTVFINDNARGSLIDTDGAIDRIFGGTIQSSQALSAEGLKSYDFQQFMLPRHFADAGTERITDYPFRDDALLLWDAIREWVRRYVAHTYAVPGSLQQDWELRAWNEQLRLPVPEGGIPGFPQIETLDQLVDALAWIVFIPSCGHAAANFPQKTDMSYAPAISGAGWRPGGGTTAAIGKDERLAFMPPLELARQQLDTLALLGGLYHTTLGDYRSNVRPYPAWFTDPVVTGELLPAFQARLRVAEQTIRARNASPARWRPYTHLLPSLVPMSTNI